MEDRPLARTDELVTERFDHELVIYDQRSHTGHSLSPDAASVWQRCDGRLSLEDIARELGLDGDVVARALLELESCGLLERPAVSRAPGYSRRQAVVRMARVGGVAISAPLIYSVVIAPAGAMAASCVPVSSGRTINGSAPGGNSGATCTGTTQTNGQVGTNPNCDSCTCYIAQSATLCAPTGCQAALTLCSATTPCCSGTGNCQSGIGPNGNPGCKL